MSFQKQETAVKTRDLLRKLVGQEVPNIVSTAKVGRVVSVDLPRLQAMVWFPGDEQPMPVSLFASVIPGSWYSQFNVGANTGTGGFGSMAVVESFRGVPYITEVLTGGQFAYNQKVQNLSLIGETADAFGNPAESIININVNNGDFEPGEAMMFGPLFTAESTGYPGGWLEIGLAFGRGGAMYRLSFDSGDLYNYSGFEDLDRWFRLIPEHENMVDRFGDRTDFHIDVAWRETSAGLNSVNTQSREFWFRVVNGSEAGDTLSAALDVSIRGSLLHRVGGLVSKKIVQELDSTPPMIKGYLGFHGSRYSHFNGEMDALSIRDLFNRSETNSWGQSTDTWSEEGTSAYLTWSTDGGASTNYQVDGSSGTIAATAAATDYRTYSSNITTRTNHDIYTKFQANLAAAGSYYEVLIPFRQTALNNYYAIVVRINTTNQMDVYLRKTVAGVTSTVGSITTNAATFAINTSYYVRGQMRGTGISIKLWAASSVEPNTWNYTSTDSSITSFGAIGCMVRRNTGNTNSGLVVKFEEIIDYTNSADSQVDPNDKTWNTGPYRSPILRIAEALQKTWMPDGSFTWNGTHITWTGKLWFSGVGANPNGLIDGVVGVSVPPANWIIKVMGSSTGNTTATVTSSGIPLAAGQSLWCAVPPGVKEIDLFDNLFIVDSPRNGKRHGIPEWAVFIAQRQHSAAATGAIPIRLGNGEWLDKWHVVGSGGGEPAFGTNWSSLAGAGSVSFTKINPSQVMLHGIASSSATQTPPSTIFVLPAGYRPLSLVQVIKANAPAAGTAPTPKSLRIDTSGNVQCTHFTSATNPGQLDLAAVIFSITAT